MDNLIKPGSKAKLGDLDVFVTAVLVRGVNSLVQYEVSWTHNGSHNCKWVEEYEVTSNDDNRLSLGFKP